MSFFQGVIDKVEEGQAHVVLEAGRKVGINIPLELLPPGSREGFVLTLAFDYFYGTSSATKEHKPVKLTTQPISKNDCQN